MVFSSTVFLFAFLPLFLAVYFIVPWRAAKNIILLAFSLVFYAWGEPIYVWLMIGSICFNWVFSLLIERSERRHALSTASQNEGEAADTKEMGTDASAGNIASTETQSDATKTAAKPTGQSNTKEALEPATPPSSDFGLFLRSSLTCSSLPSTSTRASLPTT